MEIKVTKQWSQKEKKKKHISDDIHKRFREVLNKKKTLDVNKRKTQYQSVRTDFTLRPLRDPGAFFCLVSAILSSLYDNTAH